MARTWSQACEINMTPMIDVVFQLIIFFIVTIKMEQDINPEIELEEAVHGPVIEKEDPRTLTVEVDRRGWISIHGAQLSRRKLYDIMKDRYRRHGSFPVLIRGDYRTQHRDIREVMDICTGAGIWRISFAAIQERKTVK
jgi:biopolymer transport protein ExbD